MDDMQAREEHVPDVWAQWVERDGMVPTEELVAAIKNPEAAKALALARLQSSHLPADIWLSLYAMASLEGMYFHPLSLMLPAAKIIAQVELLAEGAEAPVPPSADHPPT